MLKGVSIGAIVVSVLQAWFGLPFLFLSSLVALGSAIFGLALYLPIVGGIVGIVAGIMLLLGKRAGAFVALVGAILSVIGGAACAYIMVSMGNPVTGESGSIPMASVICFINTILLALGFVNGKKLLS